MAFSALAARMWPHFLLNGSALRRKVHNQHSSAADTARTDCRAWSPSLPGAVLLKSSALVARGETCCANPLCLSAKSHLSGEVTTASWLLLSCPPSLAVLNPPSFFERSYLHPQICLQNLLQDSCEQDCGLPLQQCCSVAEGHSDIHCKSHWAALAGLQHGKKVFPRLRVSPCVDGLGWAACFCT